MRRDDGGGGGGLDELFGSVHHSISFRADAAAVDDPAASLSSSSSAAAGGAAGGFNEGIGNRLRRTRGMGLLGMVAKGASPTRRLLPPLSPSPPSPPPVAVASPSDGCGRAGGGGEDNPPIRWRKGDHIGSGAFGQLYLVMDLDSGELLAVKQVLIGSSNATREKAQAHVRELEAEVKMLKNLSHPNIVRYIGTAREENTLNILLEFVPRGSIQSLLGRLASFPEAVIREYHVFMHYFAYEVEGAYSVRRPGSKNSTVVRLEDAHSCKECELARQAGIASPDEGAPSSLQRSIPASPSGQKCVNIATSTDVAASLPLQLHEAPLGVVATSLQSISTIDETNASRTPTQTASHAYVSYPAPPSVYTSDSSDLIVKYTDAAEASSASTPMTTPAALHIKGKYRLILKAKQALKTLNLKKLIKATSLSCSSHQAVTIGTATANRFSG